MGSRSASRFSPFFWFLTLLAALLGAVPAGAQAPAATLHGTVTSGDEGAPLPGVDITLVNLATNQVVVQATTDDRGEYALTPVPPGTYRLVATLAGFDDLANQTVTVTAGQDIRLDLVGTLRQATVGVTVTAPRPEESGASTTDSVSSKLLDGGTVADEFQALLPLLPGVVRSGDGRIQMKGGAATQGGLQVSGASVNDPSTGDFAFTMPSDAVESVDLLPNPFAAEYGHFSTGVVRVQTRRGGDRWQITPNSFFPRLTFHRNDTWRLDLATFTPRVGISGPLFNKRLLFAQSFHYRYVRTTLQSLPGQPQTDLQSLDSFTRVDTTRTGRHQWTGSVALFPRNIDKVNLNTFNPPEVTADLRQRGFNASVSDRVLISPHLVFETLANVKRYDIDIYGRSTGDMLITPETNRGNFFNDQSRTTDSQQWLNTLLISPSGRGQAHLFKLGVELLHNDYDGTSASRPVDVYRADGSLSQRITFSRPSTQDVSSFDLALFAQDRWQAASRLVVEAGARLDRDGVTGDVNLSPRLGAAFKTDNRGDGIIRSGAGLFVETAPLNVGAFPTYETRTIATFTASGLPAAAPVALANLSAPGLDVPRSLVWNLGYDRRIGPALVVRLNHLRRYGSHEFILNPELAAPTPALLLTSTGDSRYWEQEFTVRYSPGRRHELVASYVRSSAFADLNAFDQFFGNARTPLVRANEFSRSGVDAPNRLLLRGTATLPGNFQLQPVFEIRDGFPLSFVDEDQNFVGPRNEAGRFPLFRSLDLSVQRPVTYRTLKLRLGVRFYNVFGTANPRDFQGNIDAINFGRLYNPIERRWGITFWFDR